MSVFLSLLCGWFVLNLAIVAAMYFTPLRAMRLFRRSYRYSSLALARHDFAPRFYHRVERHR
jgi:hypothetical protein